MTGRLLGSTLLATFAYACLALAPPVISPAYSTLRFGQVIDPRYGTYVSPLQGCSGRTLVVLLPQLGEFDSAEFVEQLCAVEDDLRVASIDLRVIGIGDTRSALRFSSVQGLSLDKLRVDPEATLHRALGLYAGPGWRAPKFLGNGALAALLSTLPGGKNRPQRYMLRPQFDAWLNYLAMCAGIGAPGTLQEILRGYFGDQTAPERLPPTETVTAGFVKIGPGVGPVKIGPLKYKNSWKDEKGYQRPVELATVRLKHMVEVLSHWDEYVNDPRHIAQRGGFFLFESDGTTLYEYRSKGVLTYSNTMARPLTFLAPFIGAKALNPLGLGDASVARYERRQRYTGPLPPGWEVFEDETGELYYGNRALGVTQWDPPMDGLVDDLVDGVGLQPPSLSSAASAPRRPGRASPSLADGNDGVRIP